MAQTKKQVNGRGRPKKWFTSQKVSNTDTVENNLRGRPKKVRKIDDSINTKIDNHKKSVSKIEKDNERISQQLHTEKLSSKQIERQNVKTNDDKIESNIHKNADHFSLVILVLAILFFIFAVWKTFFFNRIDADDLEIKEIWETTENMDENIDENFVEYNEWENMDENINEYNEWENQDRSIQESEPEYVAENYDSNVWSPDENDVQIINSFYNSVNELNFTDINGSVDKYLKNSDTFRTYFSQNWLTRFRNKITENWVSVSNIALESWDENSTRYYNYTLNYQLKDSESSYQEQWELAIVKRNNKLLIGSIRCITTWCSKMPFFQP